MATTLNHELGQYFTTNDELKEYVFAFIQNCPSCILEPSIGRGDLIAYITTRMPGVQFDMYEIDESILLLENIPKTDVIYGDFMSQSITRQYDTIVGNPPYVRTKRGNLYIDFTEKCYRVLADNGELIFIVPSDFFKLTSAATLLNDMMTHGTFTHIFHPHNEKMFANATIDVLVFRYCKAGAVDTPGRQVLYNDKLQYITNSNGMITFGDTAPGNNAATFQDYFDVYVGLVSGKEDVFKHSGYGNIQVRNGDTEPDTYIYIETFPCDNENINAYLLQHKETLISRKIRKFNETNWFEWGAPRNIAAIRANMGAECIYIYNLTRRPVVAFVGEVGYFGGGLIMLKPKPNSLYNLHTVVAYLNSAIFKANFLFSGRFKIGHRQICHSYIPDEWI